MHLLRTKSSFTGIHAELSVVVRSGTNYRIVNACLLSLDSLNCRILLLMPDMFPHIRQWIKESFSEDNNRYRSYFRLHSFACQTAEK